MNMKEKEEIRELRDRIIKLETLVETEFRHISSQLSEIHQCIRKLNEEYGSLTNQVTELRHEYDKVKKDFDTELFKWKLIATLVTPIVSGAIVQILNILGVL